MKKIFFTTFALLALSLPLLVPQANAQTTPSLGVEFESSPLFNEANFLPGDSVERYIRVKNNGTSAKPVVVSAVEVFDPDNFGSVFNIEIKSAEELLYENSLAGFFQADEITLSNLDPGQEKQYDFFISFNPATGDEYQEKALGFDIVIGFLGEIAVGSEGSGGGTISGGGGGGGGAGGFPGSLGLAISNEAATAVTENEALITWGTNKPATSRVVYDTALGVFQPNNPPNYGYAFSTPEFNGPASVNGNTSHVIPLTGLTTGVVYYYRVISTASPPTISFEHSFQIKPGTVSNQSVQEIFAQAQIKNQPSPSVSTSNTAVNHATTTQASPDLKPQVNAQDNGDFLAQTSGLGGLAWQWWLLLLGIIIIVYLLLRRRREE